jgi:hypothetical protein
LQRFHGEFEAYIEQSPAARSIPVAADSMAAAGGAS